MSAHTPWGFGGSGAPEGEVWVWSYDGRPWQTGEADDTRLFSAPPEIAERVVRAVNAHDDLLAALEAMLGSARNDSEHTGPSARALALSAIAKARGTK